MKLTDCETKCLIKLHLAGMSIFDDKERPDCKTIKSLLKKGLLNGKGLSEKGKFLAKSLADTEHANRIK